MLAADASGSMLPTSGVVGLFYLYAVWQTVVSRDLGGYLQGRRVPLIKHCLFFCMFLKLIVTQVAAV